MLFEFGEILGTGHGIEFDLDADLGQHARDGDANFLVVHIAVVGTVQADFKALRVARVFEQFAGGGGVVFEGAGFQLGKAAQR